MVKTYERPMLKNVSLRNETAVADTCWGHHASGKTLYADLPGPGWTSFQITKGSCSLSLTNVTYHSGVEGECRTTRDGEGNLIHDNTNCKGVSASLDQISTLTSVLEKAGGNDGTSFAGEGSVVITKPPAPDSSW